MRNQGTGAQTDVFLCGQLEITTFTSKTNPGEDKASIIYTSEREMWLEDQSGPDWGKSKITIGTVNLRAYFW